MTGGQLDAPLYDGHPKHEKVIFCLNEIFNHDVLNKNIPTQTMITYISKHNKIITYLSTIKIKSHF